MCEIIYKDIYEGNFLTVKNCNNKCQYQQINKSWQFSIVSMS